MQNKIHRIFTNNLTLKIIGFILAILLWLVLSNAQDPYVRRTVTVPIEYDDTWLTENNYVALSRPVNATIPVSVRRSNTDRLKAEDFTARVKMSDFFGSKVNEAPETTRVILSITKSSSANYIEGWEYPQNMGNYVEAVYDRIQNRVYQVAVELSGELPEGLRSDEDQLIIEPNRVRVTGPTSEFGSLASVKAVIDASQITEENRTVTAKLQLFDGNNRTLGARNLTVSQDTVAVTLGLVTEKEAGISISRYMGEPAPGYGCRSADYEPKSVTIVGSKTALANVTTINIPRTALDLSGATEDVTVEVNLENYLPADVSIAKEESPIVSVTYKIEELKEKNFLINTDGFQFLGMDERYSYEIMTDRVELTLRSFAEELTPERVAEAHLQGTINVTGMEPDGTTRFVPVLISVDSQYSLVEDINVEIRITEKKKPMPFATEGISGENQEETEAETDGEISSEEETSAAEEQT